MGNEGHGRAGRDIVPLRRDIVPLKLQAQLERQAKSTHRPYAPQPQPHAGWSSFSSQASIRSFCVDAPRGLVWMATWGGVLCWDIDQSLCTRHLSEHGLPGNAISAVAVDALGGVWAAGEQGGLAYLDIDAHAPWREIPGSAKYVFRSITPADDQGILAAGDGGLFRIRNASENPAVAAEGHLAGRHVLAIVADGHGGFWTGNPWGLHLVEADGTVRTHPDVKEAVWALRPAGDGGLWVGTSSGLFRLRPVTEDIYREAEWPRTRVKWISVEGPDAVWVSAENEKGRVEGVHWERALHASEGHPDGRLEWVRGEVYSIGSRNVYRVHSEHLEKALSWAAEDAMSNAVQCLLAEGDKLWVGGPGGVMVLEGKQWRSAVAFETPDVRAFLPAGGGRSWVASARVGVRLFEGTVEIPGAYPSEALHALCKGPEEQVWGAGPHALFLKTKDAAHWERVEFAPASGESEVVQTLTYAKPWGQERLLVGTSVGLWSYQHDLKLWEPLRGPWDGSRIRVLAKRAGDDQVWIGSTKGLFGLTTAKQIYGHEVRAILFDEGRETMWLGTAAGLERWKMTGAQILEQQPSKLFHARNSGLASTLVTALAMRTVEGKTELWAGTLAGLSCWQLG